MRAMSRRGVTLIEWILLLVAAITLLALAVPAWVRAGRHERLVGCQAHLKALYAASTSPTLPKEPRALGFAYWTRLAATTPPLVSADTLRCPMVPVAINRATDYLGPKEDPATLNAKEPIGCDIEENHGDHGKLGGMVLYKSGEVLPLHPLEPGAVQDPWREATRNKCGP